MAALEIPTLTGFTTKEFRLVYKQQLTPVNSGYIQTLNRTDPFWIASYTTAPLRDTNYDATVAFLDQLKGSLNTFLAFDPRRPMPRAYQTQGVTSDPWTQAGQAAPVVTAANSALDTLTLGRLANGAIISAGDYISFQVGSIWYLYRVTVGAVAAGNTAVVTVNPTPTDLAAVTLTVRYRKACAEMKMIGNVQESDSVDGRPVFSWHAGQFMNRSV